MKLSINNKDEARRYAIAWQSWASEQNMTNLELAEWQNALAKVAETYNLTNEFKEKGIL